MSLMSREGKRNCLRVWLTSEKETVERRRSAMDGRRAVRAPLRDQLAEGLKIPLRVAANLPRLLTNLDPRLTIHP